jgi:hypothetical protein
MFVALDEGIDGGWAWSASKWWLYWLLVYLFFSKVLLWAAHFHLFVEQFPTLVALLLSLSEFGRGLDS